MFGKKLIRLAFSFCLLSFNAFASGGQFEDETNSSRGGHQDIFYDAQDEEQLLPSYKLYEGEEEMTFCCCCNVSIEWVKAQDMLEPNRDYSRKSSWVLYRDFSEEILNRTLFGIFYWGFGKKVL